MTDQNIKRIVRESYARTVEKKSSCCAPQMPCCGEETSAQAISRSMGYSKQDLNSVPEESNLGLGCGNPIALASLKEGETVLDLGSGAGFDCFLAANRVGREGRVIGVDMTPEMVAKAKDNARKGGYENIEFRVGDIEKLPVDDDAVDIIISNCVINLTPDKPETFREAFRVLKPGGKIMISDIVLLKDLPDWIRNSMEAYVGCISGALLKEDYLSAITDAGFADVKVMDETAFSLEFFSSDPAALEIISKMNIPLEELKKLDGTVVSIKVSGIKPH